MIPEPAEPTDEERQRDHAEFRAFLERVTKHIETEWPEWKRNSMDWWRKEQA